MNAIPTAAPTIAEASDAHAEAHRRRNELAASLRDAGAALDTAKRTRAEMVADAAAGNAPPPDKHRAAEETIHAAERRVMFLRDAEAGTQAAITAAESAVHKARESDWTRRMAEAIEARCDAAGALDKAVSAAREALAAYAAAGDAINAMIPEANTYKTRFHVGPLRNLRGSALRLELELTQPTGMLNGRKPIYNVENLERSSWGVPARD